ncbi:hypothetical protein EYF80_042270 [Liparis tanakae]|uniref:Uncharacterized protein n=1 Tax=Liparis tanakae TaxID=230148 RepID=A0A4Z2G1Y4_9TELE|nr:hypothetical protein EYF80_042270 [Liparis tanakae]
MENNVYSFNQTIVSHSFVSFKVYCILCNSHCLNTTFSKSFHVHTEISVWSWKFGLKSWKSPGKVLEYSPGQHVYEPCCYVLGVRARRGMSSGQQTVISSVVTLATRRSKTRLHNHNRLPRYAPRVQHLL